MTHAPLSRRGFLGAATAFAGAVSIPQVIRAGESRSGDQRDGSGATVNILDFGATPLRGKLNPKTLQREGSQDNVTAIQKAIDSLPVFDERTRRGGGVVFVPRGRFMVRNTITLPPGVVLRGEAWRGASSTISLGTGAARDPAKLMPVVELRHPDGPHRRVPCAGLDNLQIESHDASLATGIRNRRKRLLKQGKSQEEASADAYKLHNQGAICLLWRGGQGSFLRNVWIEGGSVMRLWGWPHDVPHPMAMYGILVPAESGAGPSVWDGVTVARGRNMVELNRAENIAITCPFFGSHDPMANPWLTLNDCRGIVLQNVSSEPPIYTRAVRLQAIICGGWTGWQAHGIRGDIDVPMFDLEDSDVTLLSMHTQNCRMILRERWGDDVFELAGPGGQHHVKDRHRPVSFYPGRRGVIPGQGQGQPRDWA